MTGVGGDAAALFERYRTPPPPDATDSDRALAEAAERGRVAVVPDGVEVVSYLWRPDGGSTRPPVLLVHGWGSRATHLGAIVKTLNRAGRTCLAFDAPAHGDSPGAVTSMPQVIRCMRAVVAMYGPVDTVVRHSFGGMAAALAFADRPEPGGALTAGALALIAAPSTIDSMTRRFLLAEGLPLDRMDALYRVLTIDFGYDAADFDLVRVADRLPSRLLIAHDEGDLEVPIADAERLTAARPDAEFVRTDRFGHLRILFARPVLAALARLVRS
ncbi:hypothetical protein BAL199_21504 [alpha proteobacterium BAL199]|nr:hypothetical protein BAL199_21504 [alpha proteobacterium BAL199]